MTAGTWLTSPEVEKAQPSLEGKVKLLMIILILMSECFYLSKVSAWNKILPFNMYRERQKAEQLSAGSDLERKEPCPGLSLAQLPILHSTHGTQDGSDSQLHLEWEPEEGHA